MSLFGFEITKGNLNLRSIALSVLDLSGKREVLATNNKIEEIIVNYFETNFCVVYFNVYQKYFPIENKGDDLKGAFIFYWHKTC